MRINFNDPDALFIPLVSDYGFRIVFGNERNTLFLRRTVQALIQSKVPIREVSFHKNTFDAVVKDSRGGIYDLACVDEKGTHFIIEMQVSDAPYFFQRMNRDDGPFLRLPQGQLAGTERQLRLQPECTNQFALKGQLYFRAIQAALSELRFLQQKNLLSNIDLA